MNVRTRNLLAACKSLENAANKMTKWRPKFHLSPKVGWMNDPNGLCQFNGKYHIFFQYSPFDTKPGLNYWGHFTTEDFVNYDYLSPALCSDENFDCHGVYSGSALVSDNKLHLFYTGNVKLSGNEFDYVTSGREHNTIHAVSDDGVIFDTKKVVLKNSDYPSTVTCHVRDPKVYNFGDGYIMLLGARSINDSGEILIYRSSDLNNWKFSGTISSDRPFGYMWECPDLIESNGKLFICFSPQGIKEDGFRFNNIYQSGYAPIIGDFPNNCKIGEFTEFDCGFDFYAPQTFIDEQKRRILIGWAGLPDLDGIYVNPTEEYNWVHCLTVPRVITEKDGKLLQNPADELKKLRKNSLKSEINGEFYADSSDVFEAEIQMSESQNAIIEIKDSCTMKYINNVFMLSLNSSGCGRKNRSVKLERLDSIRILCDTSIIEVFINGGEKVFTTRFYPDANDKGIRLQNIKGAINIWQLDSFNIVERS